MEKEHFNKKKEMAEIKKESQKEGKTEKLQNFVIQFGDEKLIIADSEEEYTRKFQDIQQQYPEFKAVEAKKIVGVINLIKFN